MDALTLSVIAATLVAAFGALELRALRVAAGNPERPEPVLYPPAIGKDLLALAEGISKNGARIDDLKLAVSDGIARVDRADKRIEKTVASARRLVAASGLEHPGLEAEASELLASNVDPPPDPELQPVPELLVSDGPSGIPGATRQQLAELREALSA